MHELLDFIVYTGLSVVALLGLVLGVEGNEVGPTIAGALAALLVVLRIAVALGMKVILEG